MVSCTDTFAKIDTKLRGMSPMWDAFERGIIDSVIAPTGRGKWTDKRFIANHRSQTERTAADAEKDSRFESAAAVVLSSMWALASSILALASSSFARAAVVFCGTCRNEVQRPIAIPPNRTTTPTTKQIHATAWPWVRAITRLTAARVYHTIAPGSKCGQPLGE